MRAATSKAQEKPTGVETSPVKKRPSGIAFRMADVARFAGVSVSTVSNVINNRAIVRPELAAKVRQAMDAIQFSPNRAARGLRTGQTEIIGMLIPDVTNPFYAQVLRGTEDYLNERGYELMVCNSNRRPDLEQRHLSALHAQRVDGMILVPSNSYAAREILRRSLPPLVFVDCLPFDSKANAVVIDNTAAAYQATRYLIGLGHKRIALIAGELTYTSMLERVDGYRNAMREAGHAEYTVQGNTDVGGGYNSTKELFKLNEPPTAIFALNNRMTLGAIQALRDLNIHCPNDVSLITFDDPEWANVISPTLTAINQPSYQIGQSAARLLLTFISSQHDQPARETQVIELKSNFLIRESTGPCMKG
jgi:LacI family transcriptional regulator